MLWGLWPYSCVGMLSCNFLGVWMQCLFCPEGQCTGRQGKQLIVYCMRFYKFCDILWKDKPSQNESLLWLLLKTHEVFGSLVFGHPRKTNSSLCQKFRIPNVRASRPKLFHPQCGGHEVVNVKHIWQAPNCQPIQSKNCEVCLRCSTRHFKRYHLSLCPGVLYPFLEFSLRIRFAPHASHGQIFVHVKGHVSTKVQGLELVVWGEAVRQHVRCQISTRRRNWPFPAICTCPLLLWGEGLLGART